MAQALQLQRDHTNHEKLSGIVGALSYALDITEGQPEGHAVRSCMIGMRLAQEIGLSPADRSALFYALLLKDLGCSSNAAKVCYLFGADDRTVKQNFKYANWQNPLAFLPYILRNIAPGESLYQRAARFASIAMAGNKDAKELVQIRCERGALIARDWTCQKTPCKPSATSTSTGTARGTPTGSGSTRFR